MLPEASGPTVFLRARADYRPELDLRADAVAVDVGGLSEADLERRIRSWQSAGYAVEAVLPLTLDPGGAFVEGREDGRPHPELAERDASGAPLRAEDPAGAAPGALFVSPVGAWLEALKARIRRCVAAGATSVRLEVEGLPAAGGYGEAAKAEWPGIAGDAWRPPGESPAAFFQGARVRAELGVRAVDALLRFVREGGAGRPVPVRLGLPSPLASGETARVLATAALSRLPVDGIVARADPAALLRSVPLEGREAPRPFALAWLEASYFANLMEGVPERPLVLDLGGAERPASGSGTGSAGRAEPDSAAAADARLLAALFHPAAGGYETAAGSAAAGRVFWAREFTPGREELRAPRIGLLLLDAFLWQRGGPQGASMRSLYGLALPLLAAGVPLELVPGERVADREFLARYRVLLLSYDAQKPPGPEVNDALAEWVRRGGVLLLFGGENPYNAVGEWWERHGFPGPTEHLLRQCGAPVDLARRRVRDRRTAYRAVGASVSGSAEGAAGPLRLPLGPHLRPGEPLSVRCSGSGRLGRVRLTENGRVRADFVAGSVGERPFLAEALESRAEKAGRRFGAEGFVVYRFHRLGPEAVLELDIEGGVRVELAGGAAGTLLEADPAAELAGVPARLSVPDSDPVVVAWPTAGATLLLRAAGEAGPGAAAWSAPIGAGALFYCGVPASFGADSAAGAALVRGLARLAATRAKLPWPGDPPPRTPSAPRRVGTAPDGHPAGEPLLLRRGLYAGGWSFGRSRVLPGLYLDLLDPDLPLVENPRLPYRGPALFRAVRLLARIPDLLQATCRARALETSVARLRLLLEGPEGAPATLRVYTAGLILGGVEAIDPRGRRLPVEARPEGRTLWLRCPLAPGGVAVTLRWVRPEARRTE